MRRGGFPLIVTGGFPFSFCSLYTVQLFLIPYFIVVAVAPPCSCYREALSSEQRYPRVARPSVQLRKECAESVLSEASLCFSASIFATAHLVLEKIRPTDIVIVTVATEPFGLNQSPPKPSNPLLILLVAQTTGRCRYSRR